MRFVQMAPLTDQVSEMQRLYGEFDIGLDGLPTPAWVARNLVRWRTPEMMQLYFFPDVYVKKVLVNRRIFGPIGLTYEEICSRWNAETRAAHGLSQFCKCYVFCSGDLPTLFWYGAAWRLSPQVGGEVLGEVVKIFCRHGFVWSGSTDKRRLRDFEFW